MISELYAVLQGEVLRFLTRRAGDRALAEDIAQDVFVKALGHTDELTDLTPAQRRAWLYTCARRTLIDAQRRAKPLPLIESWDAPSESDFTRPVVEEALATLSEQQRQIVVLRHFGGLDSREIGRMLGLPPATVRTRLRAAMQVLRKELS